MANKYYVHYVDNSSPILRKFNTLKEAKSFVSKFKKNNPTHEEGYWIDFIVKGEIEIVNSYYDDQA